jgi:hypothetical protein
MKKLNKLTIHSEKLMKNEELMTLKGGYGEPTCQEGPGWYPCFCVIDGVKIFAGCLTNSNDCAGKCIY